MRLDLAAVAVVAQGIVFTPLLYLAEPFAPPFGPVGGVVLDQGELPQYVRNYPIATGRRGMSGPFPRPLS